MSGERIGRLERRIESWARWVDAGGRESTGKSLLARWMDSKGHIVFGGGPAQTSDALESAIEAAVLRMAAADQLRADVLRLEFQAGAYEVAQRRNIRGYDPRGATHQKNASALGISVRTYRRRLAEAKNIISEALAPGSAPHAVSSAF